MPQARRKATAARKTTAAKKAAPTRRTVDSVQAELDAFKAKVAEVALGWTRGEGCTDEFLEAVGIDPEPFKYETVTLQVTLRVDRQEYKSGNSMYDNRTGAYVPIAYENAINDVLTAYVEGIEEADVKVVKTV